MSLATSCGPVELDVERLRARFLVLVARIEVHARIAFRHVKCPAQKEDAIAEAVALTWLWFVRLARRGTDGSVFVSALAGYAARAVRSGRRLCGQERAQDVLSPLAQQRHGFTVGPLPPASSRDGNVFDEALIDNTRTPPDDQACFRLDFPVWRKTLTQRDRRMADDLMVGERTLDVSKKYGLTPARVSQKRREFHDDWRRFHGEDAVTAPCAGAP